VLLALLRELNTENMKKDFLEQIAQASAKWIGSTTSLVLHTILFASFFLAGFFGFAWNTVLLVLTTVVSLEAIYLSIFIQMSVNRNTESLLEVEEDIGEIQEDIDEIQEDVDEIQIDVDEIQEDVVEMTEEETHSVLELKTLEHIEETLLKLQEDVTALKKNKQ